MEWCSLSEWLTPPPAQKPSHHKFSRRPPRVPEFPRISNSPAIRFAMSTTTNARQKGRADSIYDQQPTSPLRAQSIFSKKSRRVYQASVHEGDDDDGRSVFSRTGSRVKRTFQVTIPARGLKWSNLQRYLELEFPEGSFSQDQKTVTVLNESYIVKLPRKLDDGQLQDIDNLRGDQEDIDEFLEELEEEKQISLKGLREALPETQFGTQSGVDDSQRLQVEKRGGKKARR